MNDAADEASSGEHEPLLGFATVTEAVVLSPSPFVFLSLMRARCCNAVPVRFCPSQ
jgi:hypothetical protein